MAGATRETALIEGASVFSEGDPPSIWILLSGELVLEPPQGGETVLVGAAALAGCSVQYDGSVHRRA